MDALTLIAVIHWSPDPEVFQLGPLAPRWYGLMFAVGFLLGYQILLGIFRREGRSEVEVYRLFLYVFIGTMVGARLGHCLFYQPDYYLSHPLEILKIWEGGLASHGGTLGVLFAVWLYLRKSDMKYLWLGDRMSIPIALVSGFIRLGNLFNSEIIGVPTELPWAFVFERVDNLPRHPAQLYEALTYFAIFFINRELYRRWGKRAPTGRLLGIMFIGIFTARIFIEFIKENQVPFEEAMAFNMGQLLSIPFVLFGLWLIWRSRREA